MPLGSRATPRRVRVRRLLAGLLCALVVPLAGCAAALAPASGSGGTAEGETADGATETERLSVVATTTVLRDFVTRVGGARVAATGVLRPGGQAHDVGLSAAMMLAVSRADLVVANGAGLEEPWLDRLLAGAGYDGPVVDASSRVALRRGEHGAPDPHVWTDVANASTMVRAVTAGLVGVDPDGASHYRRRAERYVTRLRALDAWVTRQIGTLDNPRLVTSHDAFGYYAAAYGLDIVGAVIPSFDSAAELSGRRLTELVDVIRRTGAGAIFAAAGLSAEAARIVADEAGVPVVADADALYGDALGPAGSPAETYVGLMEHNTRSIVRALDRE